MKKFISNALLSVVMDKSAREKLRDHQEQRGKAGFQSGRADKITTRENAKQVSGVEDDILSTISGALAEARVEAGDSGKAAVTKPPPAQKTGHKPEQPARSSAKPASPERRALIEHALTIHRQKQAVLDELPQETREKLMVMAMYAIDPKSLSPDVSRAREAAEARNNKNPDDSPAGLVDDIGSLAGTRRRRRR